MNNTPEAWVRVQIGADSRMLRREDLERIAAAARVQVWGWLETASPRLRLLYGSGQTGGP